ncbi:hypothetical protein ACOSP7_030853 [Xanthoceras sorbifolium]
MLFTCSFAEEVWLSVGLWNMISSAPHSKLKILLECLKELLDSSQFLLVCLLAWNVCSARNCFVYEGYSKIPSILGVLYNITFIRVSECSDQVVVSRGYGLSASPR